MNHQNTYVQCNTFTPQIKGSFCGLNVMYVSQQPQLPGVLQLPWSATTSQVCYNFPMECGITSHRNAYNYATTSTDML